MSQKRFEYISTSFWKRVNKNSLTWWYVLETSWRDLCKTSWNVLNKLENVFTRCVEDVLKTSCRRMAKAIIWSWSRHLEDVFWRRMSEANIFVLIKTSSEDEEERRLHQDGCLLGCSYSHAQDRWIYESSFKKNWIRLLSYK